MAEKIVSLSGDSSVGGVSRYLDPTDRNFSMVVFQQGKPPLDSEINLMQQLQNYARAELVRRMIHSGCLNIAELEFGLDNKLKFKEKQEMYVNGYKIVIPEGYEIELTEPPTESFVSVTGKKGYREDLIFLEAWFEEVAPAGNPEGTDSNVYQYGAENYTTLTNDLQDTSIGDETTRRIQLRWRIRVAEDIDFETDEEGLPQVYAQGQRDTESTVKFALDSEDRGLYKAYDTTLGVDGYAYAIPLFKLKKRNRGLYSQNNGNGGTIAIASKYRVDNRTQYTLLDENDNTIAQLTLPTGYEFPDSVVDGTIVTSIDNKTKTNYAPNFYNSGWSNPTEETIINKRKVKIVANGSTTIIKQIDISYLKPNTVYTLKGKVTGGTVGNTSVDIYKIGVIDIAGINSLGVTAQTFTTPANTTGLYLRLLVDANEVSGTEVYFEDIIIEEGDTTSEETYWIDGIILLTNTQLERQSDLQIVNSYIPIAINGEDWLEYVTYNQLLPQDRDILDLRHKVSLTGFDYQKLLEENFDKLLRGELQTKEKTKLKKTYFGARKTPIDSNTIFYASFDGTTTAEIGGSSQLVEQYVPMPTGLGLNLKLNDVDATDLQPLSSILNDSFTIDFWLDITKVSPKVGYLITLVNSSNNEKSLAISSREDLGKGVICLYVNYLNNDTNANFDFYCDIDLSLHVDITKPIHIRLIYDKINNKLILYANGKKTLDTILSDTIIDSDKVLVGGYISFPNTYHNSFNGAVISDLMVSNIDRGNIFATLPQDFIDGYAEIVPAFNEQRRSFADPLTSQYTVDIIKADGSNTEKHITVTQATQGQWSANDTIKIKGLTGELINGVIDSDTILARVVEDNSSDTTKVKLNDVTGLAVNDQIAFYDSSLATLQGTRTITAIDTTNNIITLDTALTLTCGMVAVEITSTSSSPVVKFNNNGTLTTVSGTWSGLGTNEATFTLTDPTTDGLTNENIQIEYSVNYPAGQGKVPVYSEVKMAEINGKRLVPSDTITIVDDFAGKVSGSTVENPHISKKANSTSLLAPTDVNFAEIIGSEYTQIDTLDSTVQTATTSVSGEIPQQIFSFNLIEIVERKFGEIPAIDKVQWLKDNLHQIRCWWRGYGVNPNGNKAYFACFNNVSNTYINPMIATSSTVEALTWIVSDNSISSNNVIDVNGYMHFITYTDASDGVTASTIYTDYVSIEVELKSSAYTDNGYQILAPENNRAREEMNSGILSVRPETREVERYPLGKVDENSDIVLYGDYVPPYEVISSTGTYVHCLSELGHFIATDLSSAVGYKQGSHHWNNLLWRFNLDRAELLGKFGYAKIPLAVDSLGVNIGRTIFVKDYGFSGGYIAQYAIPTIDRDYCFIYPYLVEKDNQLMLFVTVAYHNGELTDLRLGGAITDRNAFLIPLECRPLEKIQTPEYIANTLLPTEWRTPTGEILGYLDENGNVIAVYA